MTNQTSDETWSYIRSVGEIHLHRGYDGAVAAMRWQLVEGNDKADGKCGTSYCLKRLLAPVISDEHMNCDHYKDMCVVAKT